MRGTPAPETGQANAEVEGCFRVDLCDRVLGRCVTRVYSSSNCARDSRNAIDTDGCVQGPSSGDVNTSVGTELQRLDVLATISDAALLTLTPAVFDATVQGHRGSDVDLTRHGQVH